jgi:undecaprenyl-diphosphatase
MLALRDLAKRFKSSRDRLPWWSRYLLGVAVVLLALGVFLKLTSEVFEDPRTTSFDEAVAAWVGAHRAPLLNRAALEVTALGSVTLVTFFGLGAIAVLLAGRDRKGVVHLLASVGGGVLAMQSLKAFFERPRPIAFRLTDASGFSYPSGHTVTAAVFYVTLAIVGARHFREPVYRRTLIGLAVVTTALVALSRVYLGVHYVTDVASGLLVGAGWAVLMASLFAYIEERLAQIRKGRERDTAAEASAPPAQGASG